MYPLTVEELQKICLRVRGRCEEGTLSTLTMLTMRGDGLSFFEYAVTICQLLVTIDPLFAVWAVAAAASKNGYAINLRRLGQAVGNPFSRDALLDCLQHGDDIDDPWWGN